MSDAPGDDEKSFTVNFSSDGAGLLKDAIKEKLKEYMGDYTDDTLVEYVIVLLRNGRRKDEARRELNVFLGDDSASFVSWLWDHLSVSLHLYVQQEFVRRKVDKEKPTDEFREKRSSQTDPLSSNMQTDLEYEREKSPRLPRTRRKREWKSLVQETDTFPLRSTITEILRSEVKNHARSNLAKRSRSPIPQVNKKRRLEDEGHPAKRDMTHPVIGASRRLLQFAVRDAVRTVQQPVSRTEPRTVQQPVSRTEPSSKRLCSVIATSIPDSVLNERPQRARPVTRVPGLSTALKAAVEAAQDVTKARHSGGVFNRLGHDMETSETVNKSSHNIAPVLEDGELEDFDEVAGSIDGDYYHSRYDGDSAGDVTMLDRHDEAISDSASDNDGYDNVDSPRQGSDGSRSVSPANKDRPTLNSQCSVAQNDDEVVRKTRLIDQDPPANAVAISNASSKIVNISVNVNTWKPPHYQTSRKFVEVENGMDAEKNEASTGKLLAQKEKVTTMPTSVNLIARPVVQKEGQKTAASTSVSYTTTRPSEDPDSRTVFVSNVHFAATKDSLSRHFNKFGEVLKVIIVTDGTTGQPTGSAYVEFLRKESAELALSLNGASFMSRILKVTRRNSSYHDGSSMLGWPRMARASPFASRMGRMPLPRGVLASPFRGRLPIKSGARSLQWKRGTSTTESAKGLPNASLASGGNVASPTGKNLTYVRTETKTDGNSGPT